MNSLARISSIVAAALLWPPLASAAVISGPGGAIPASGTGGQGASWPTGLPMFPLESSTKLPIHVIAIESIKLTGFSHTWMGDLQIVLYDPNGRGYNILHRPGFMGTGFGSAGDFDGTYTFADSGDAFPIGVPGNAVVPPGTYDLSFGTWVDGTANIFNRDLLAIPGPPGFGTWTLRIYDWAAGDTGMLQSWSMQFAGQIGPVPGSLGLLAMPLLAGPRRRRGRGHEVHGQG